MSRKQAILFFAVISLIFVLSTNAQDGIALGSHPRLFFSQSELASLREQAETTHRDLWEPIQQFVAGEIRTSSIPADAPTSDDLNTYRSYGDRLIPLAFVCVIGQQPEVCEMARSDLLTITAWDRWDRGGERDLGFGHILFGSAVAFDWMYNEFTPDERAALAKRIGQRAQEMFDASTQDYSFDWNNWWANSFVQNHYWVNNAALGIAGLALMGEIEPQSCSVVPTQRVNLRAAPSTNAAILNTGEPSQSLNVIGQQKGDDGLTWWHLEGDLWVREDVVKEQGSCEALMAIPPQQWVEQAAKAYERVNAFLEGIGDGTWHEGIFYQDYGLATGIPFLLNLRRLTDLDLIPHTYLNNYAQWRLYNLLPGTTQYLMAYGDLEWWWEDIRATGVLRFVASEYDDPTAEWVAQRLIQYGGRAADIWKTPWYVFEFLYYDPSIVGIPPSGDQPLARTFPDLEGVIWRTGWDDDALIFGLKTGAYGGRFSYETFVQQRFPWEPPCEQTGCSLNAGHDHDDANSFYLFAGGIWLAPEVQGENNRPTPFHNTLLIDGNGQQRPYDETPEGFANTDGVLQEVANTPHFDYLAADATQSYGNVEDLFVNMRYVAFVRPDYLLMVDHVASEQPHQVEWVTHFSGDASLQGDWGRGGNGDHTLGVQIVNPMPFTGELGDDGNPFLRTAPIQPTTQTTLVHLLVPTTSGAWETRPTAELQVDTSISLLIRVKHHDGSERSDDLVVVYSPDAQKQGARVGSYYFDGQFAAIRYDSSGEAERLFLVGGTQLSKIGEGVGAGQILAANVDPTAHFEAVFSGTHIDVSTTSKRPVMLYAPFATEVTVNGLSMPLEREGDFVIIHDA